MARNDAKPRGRAQGHGDACQCPFCDAQVEQAYPFCKECGRKLRRCPKCGRVLEVSESTCPNCKQ
jgi:predicted amidophosphoribosyltransferase